jgi:hypothetical protein
VAGLDQALEVVVGALHRHAAHRNVLPEMLAPPGEHDAEHAARDLRIGEEQLVEVPHAVEQEAVGIRRLDLDVLRHHRRGARDVGGRRSGGRVGRPRVGFEEAALDGARLHRRGV